LRCAWFSQNFSESFLREPVLEGNVAFPAADVREPFLDVDDVADVAVAALTDPRHAGQIYDLTGPRLLGFAEAVQEVASASERNVRYTPISAAYAEALRLQMPPELGAGIVMAVKATRQRDPARKGPLAAVPKICL
jgi:uncharacterized protein YbjT (DUF2867 family)